MLRAGLPHRARADAGKRAAGAPRACPADRVAMVADEPLDAPGHDHVVRGQGAAVPEGKRHGHAIAEDVDGGLAAGGCGVVSDPADEPRCGAEVVEVERLIPLLWGCQPGRVRRNSPSMVTMVASLAILLDTIRLLRCRCEVPVPKATA